MDPGDISFDSSMLCSSLGLSGPKCSGMNWMTMGNDLVFILASGARLAGKDRQFIAELSQHAASSESSSNSMSPLLSRQALTTACFKWSGIDWIISFVLLAMSSLDDPSSSCSPGVGASIKIWHCLIPSLAWTLASSIGIGGCMFGEVFCVAAFFKMSLYDTVISMSLAAEVVTEDEAVLISWTAVAIASTTFWEREVVALAAARSIISDASCALAIRLSACVASWEFTTDAIFSPFASMLSWVRT